MDNTELKPCLMCGCKAFSKLEKFSIAPDVVGTTTWKYRCPKCKTTFLFEGKTEAEIVEQWNLRTDPYRDALRELATQVTRYHAHPATGTRLELTQALAAAEKLLGAEPGVRGEG